MPEGYEIEGLKKAYGLLAYTDHKRALVLCFVLGFVVRLMPEVLSYPYPIGFDTVYYAARIKSGVGSLEPGIFVMTTLRSSDIYV